MKKNKIYLTGHTGLLGSAIYRSLRKKKNIKILLTKRKNINLENYKSI